jgi:hypothetical protein
MSPAGVQRQEDRSWSLTDVAQERLRECVLVDRPVTAPSIGSPPSLDIRWKFDVPLEEAIDDAFPGDSWVSRAHPPSISGPFRWPQGVTTSHARLV